MITKSQLEVCGAKTTRQRGTSGATPVSRQPARLSNTFAKPLPGVPDMIRAYSGDYTAGRFGRSVAAGEYRPHPTRDAATKRHAGATGHSAERRRSPRRRRLTARAATPEVN